MSKPDDDLVAAVDEVFDEAPRLSPAARAFMSGELPDDIAVMWGYKRPDPPPDDDPQ